MTESAVESRASSEVANDGLEAALPGALAFQHITQRFTTPGRDLLVLDDVSFEVAPGAVACVVGPSGCGKSTLLALAAGLQSPSGGSVVWDGHAVRRGPNHDLGMAFQQPGLFPWMTVRGNVAIGLSTRGMGKHDALRTADEFLATVGLSDFRDAYPSQLSGGMAQRVGIARALALRPRLLLLDEPFAAVDAFTRIKLQQELKSLLARNRATVLFVTHDVSEAIFLGDVIIAMSQRPAHVQRIIRIERADRDRSSAAYAHRLAEVLECLGVHADSAD